MKFVPTAIKIILNIMFFIIYFALASFGTGFILTYILKMSYDYDKVGYVILVFIFIITFIFRKFFYISLKNN